MVLVLGRELEPSQVRNIQLGAQTQVRGTNSITGDLEFHLGFQLNVLEVGVGTSQP